MMTIIRSIVKRLSANAGGIIFFAFIAIVSGMFWRYLHSTGKVKILQAEVRNAMETNKKLSVQNEELMNHIQTQIKKNHELTNELLQLSEERTEGYKKVIQYDGRLKNAAIKKPARVERLINNSFDRVLDDVAKTTGAETKQ